MADEKPKGIVQTGKGIKVGGGAKPLWAREKLVTEMQEVKKKESAIMAGSADNRIFLLLDCSGSMSDPAGAKTKIGFLQDAYDAFIAGVDFSNTSIGIETFPFTEEGYSWDGSTHGIRQPLCNDANLLMTETHKLRAAGGTPMSQAMEHVIHSETPTRCVMISDGEANTPRSAILCAEQAYKPAGIPIDCIHIGRERSGEDTLQEIARITGGIYIKFTDVQAFSKMLTYLTPRYRAMLTGGQVTAAELGATEIKYLGGK